MRTMKTHGRKKRIAQEKEYEEILAFLAIDEDDFWQAVSLMLMESGSIGVDVEDCRDILNEAIADAVAEMATKRVEEALAGMDASVDVVVLTNNFRTFEIQDEYVKLLAEVVRDRGAVEEE